MHLGLSHTYAEALPSTYAPIQPRGFRAPELLTYNEALHDALGLADVARENAADLFSGTRVADDARPLAMAYGGHQFGHFAGQLGDGRALLLGERVDPDGRRFDIHLKGSGPTPFSRGGDGLAAIGPILREHLVSEAMFHLGVPTSRVLATIATGEQVLRQQGRLPGAVLARVASSHLRVGTFQLFAAAQAHQTVDQLTRYTLERHFPEHQQADNPALALLQAVAGRQATLIADWMAVGFVHGVMNTDNCTVSGETLDYGPCAFMEVYDPNTVFSSIDQHGRYAFGRQPGIAQWNLARLGEALLPMLDPDEDQAIRTVQAVLERFAEAFSRARLQTLRTKLGLQDEHEQDAALVEELFAWMQADRRDHTLTFRQLAASLRTGEPLAEDARFEKWDRQWRTRLSDEPVEQVADRMDTSNPLYIPRNHRVEHALAAAEDGDLGPFTRMQRVLATPFTDQPNTEDLKEPAPDDAAPYVTFCGT